jgi:hypothetical protein
MAMRRRVWLIVGLLRWILTRLEGSSVDSLGNLGQWGSRGLRWIRRVPIVLHIAVGRHYRCPGRHVVSVHTAVVVVREVHHRRRINFCNVDGLLGAGLIHWNLRSSAGFTVWHGVYGRGVGWWRMLGNYSRDRCWLHVAGWLNGSIGDWWSDTGQPDDGLAYLVISINDRPGLPVFDMVCRGLRRCMRMHDLRRRMMARIVHQGRPSRHADRGRINS